MALLRVQAQKRGGRLGETTAQQFACQVGQLRSGKLLLIVSECRPEPSEADDAAGEFEQALMEVSASL
ncbi:hypothetical protein, partial [Streptomyces sp. NPDC008001]|uniref:hypothetical protein n=1 Tax=Streptomyces sp. NPDC008001 TaxID=3364804 RepID=UPI0036E11711